MLDIEGAITFKSWPDVTKGDNDDNVAVEDMGVPETGVLFNTRLDVSEVNVADCKGGTVKGKVEVGREEEELRAPLVVGSKGEGYSGKFELGRLAAPVGKDVLKPEYCICGMEGGIERPGGGRSKDCWCIWGNPFGVP